jgi:hypothetical protein
LVPFYLQQTVSQEFFGQFDTLVDDEKTVLAHFSRINFVVGVLV